MTTIELPHPQEHQMATDPATIDYTHPTLTTHPNPDDNLTQAERCRRQAHRDIDRICDAWPLALTDLDARGFSSGRTYDGTPRGKAELTPVEAAASATDFAGAWIAELADTIHALQLPALNGRQPWTAHTARQPMHHQADKLANQWPATDPAFNRLNRLAGRSWAHWPPMPTHGTHIAGITIGERTNHAETCVRCSDPVVSGRDDHGAPTLRRDADGNAYHPNCYYDRWRDTRDRKQTATCNVDDCQLPAHSRGWCRGHYDRWRRTGVIGGALGIDHLAEGA